MSTVELLRSSVVCVTLFKLEEGFKRSDTREEDWADKGARGGWRKTLRPDLKTTAQTPFKTNAPQDRRLNCVRECKQFVGSPGN